MHARGSGKRGLTIGLVVLGWLTFGLAAPLLISAGPVDFSLGSSSVVASPLDSYTVSSPIVVAQVPKLTIERGTIHTAEASGLASIAGVATAGRTARLIVDGASLRVEGDQPGIQANATAALSPLLEAFSGLQFETATLRRSSVTITLPDGHSETFSDVEAEISHKRRSVSVKGSAVVRGQSVTFETILAAPAEKRTGSTTPLKFTFKSQRLTASFDGRVVVGGTLQLLGAIDFSIPDIRQAARWLGAAWPAGTGLRDVAGRGQLEWTGAALALNKAVFKMDGNEATGALSFKFSDPRPSIGGTLALTALDLSRYFADTSRGLSAGGKIYESFAEAEISLPLAQHFDADLRVSADRVKIGVIQLGRSAAALSLANGRLLADLGAVEFDGGRGSGQLIADVNGRVPRVTLRGRLEDVDLARATTALWGHAVATGRGTVTTDLTATGRSGRELVDAATGKAVANVRGSGTRLGVDLQALSAAAEKRALEGWRAGARGQTVFDEIDGRFSITNGVVLAEDLRANSKDEVTAISGTADLSTGRLNLTISRMPVAPKGGIAAAAVKPPEPISKMQISGPWAAPTIRSEALRNKAQPAQQAVPASRRGDLAPTFDQ